ncbi:MAG: [FeFe] hydrogenase H-cluster radical SAM maturase HydG, partial [Rikenellaceae bacterium]
MYNPKSNIASEFISHSEILESINFAEANRENRPMIEAILAKAAESKGLSHREAALLLECDDKEVIDKIFALASSIKEKIYGRRIVIFAPLYLSNYCVNGCLYCPYRLKNREVTRRKLSQCEIEREV